MNRPTIKLCKDCKHHIASDSTMYVTADKCMRWGRSIELVRGTLRDASLDFCSAERSSGWLESRLHGECGKEGRFWEPKDK